MNKNHRVNRDFYIAKGIFKTTACQVGIQISQEKFST